MVGKILNELTTRRWTILNSLGWGLILLGIFAWLEHYFLWSPLDLKDFFGHEYFGLFTVLLGFVLISKQANKLFKKLIKR